MCKQISSDSFCNILALDPAVNQETCVSGRIYQGITLTCGRVEFGAIATPTGSRWMSNNYIIDVSSDGLNFLKSVVDGVRVAVRGSENQLQTEGLLLSVTPGWAVPSRMRMKCCYYHMNMGSICCSLSQSPTHLSHITNINPFTTLSQPFRE